MRAERKQTAMKYRKLLIGSIVVALAAAAAWLAWDKLTRPVPPAVALDGVSPDTAHVVSKALDEVRRRPRSRDAWSELSMALMANGFFKQAMLCFVQVERLDPAEPRWPYFQGALMLMYGNRDGFPKLRRALDLTRSPEERAAVLFQLALALIEDGQLDEAEEHLGELRRIEEDSPGVHLGLGLLAHGRDDRALARAHLSRLTEHPSARKKVCALLAGLNADNDKLARSYRQQAGQFPDDQPWATSFDNDLKAYRPEPVRPLAPYYELEAQGRGREAVEYLRDYAARSPNEEVCFTLGFALFRMNQFEEAAEEFRRATGYNPRNAKAHLFMANALYLWGEQRHRQPDGKGPALELFQKAVAAADQALGLQWDLPHAHMIRGQALKHLGRIEESLQALREAVVVGSESAEFHVALGEGLAEAGQLPEALQHLENAVQLARPDDPRPRAALEKWRAKARKGP